MVSKKIFVIGQSQTLTANGYYIRFMISTEYGNLVQDLPYITPTKEQFIVPPIFRGEDFFILISANQKQRIAHGDHVWLVYL
jgi:hypothetical protein